MAEKETTDMSLNGSIEANQEHIGVKIEIPDLSTLELNDDKSCDINKSNDTVAVSEASNTNEVDKIVDATKDVKIKGTDSDEKKVINK